MPEGTPVVPVRDLPSRPRRNRKSETVRRAFSETYLDPGAHHRCLFACDWSNKALLAGQESQPLLQAAWVHPCAPQLVAAAALERARCTAFAMHVPPPSAPAANFILPVFVHDGEENIPIDSMPGVARLGWRHGLLDAVKEARSVGVNQVRLAPAGWWRGMFASALASLLARLSAGSLPMFPAARPWAGQRRHLPCDVPLGSSPGPAGGHLPPDPKWAVPSPNRHSLQSQTLFCRWSSSPRPPST